MVCKQNQANLLADAKIFTRHQFGRAGAVRVGECERGARTGNRQLQINQVLGTQSDKYVAGKDAVIRVLLKEPIAVNPAEQKVVVKRGSETVATLEPQPAGEPQKILNFTCPSRAACGDWKAGDYTFEATIGTATQSATAKFQERRPLRVLAVGVKANYGPGDVRSVEGKWKQQGDFMKQVFPISPDGYKWIIGQDLDLSDDKYNLKTDDGQREVWMALTNLQPQECTAIPKRLRVTI